VVFKGKDRTRKVCSRLRSLAPPGFIASQNTTFLLHWISYLADNVTCILKVNALVVTRRALPYKV
jgi:hypothetical protein